MHSTQPPPVSAGRKGLTSASPPSMKHGGQDPLGSVLLFITKSTLTDSLQLQNGFLVFPLRFSSQASGSGDLSAVIGKAGHEPSAHFNIHDDLKHSPLQNSQGSLGGLPRTSLHSHKD